MGLFDNNNAILDRNVTETDVLDKSVIDENSNNKNASNINTGKELSYYKNIVKPPIPTNTDYGTVKVNSTSTNSTHTQSYFANVKNSKGSYATDKEFSEFDQLLTNNGGQHPLTAFVNEGLLKISLSEITAVNGYRWEKVKRLLTEEFVIETKGVTSIYFGDRSKKAENSNTNCKVTINSKLYMSYDVLIFKDDNATPFDKQINQKRFWKDGKPKKISTSNSKNFPTVIKKSVELAISMRTAKNHFDMNCITQYNELIETLNALGFYNDYLGIGVEISSAIAVGSSVIPIVGAIEAIVGLGIDALNSYYGDLQTDSARQVTNDNEYIKWIITSKGIKPIGLNTF